MSAILARIACVLLVFAGAAGAQDVKGLLTANGKSVALARKGNLAGLVVRLNPDAKILSAAPLHPAFTTFIRSAVFVRWKPSAFDEKRVAGRFWTEGTQSEFGQKWSYDVTFSAPIALDPAATTVPRK